VTKRKVWEKNYRNFILWKRFKSYGRSSETNREFILCYRFPFIELRLNSLSCSHTNEHTNIKLPS